MAEIKEYKKRDGTTAYMFNSYVGINPETGKTKRTTRRGFKTKKEARLALAQLELREDEPIPKNKVQKKYITFKNVYEMWFENYKRTNLSEHTISGTERFFRIYVLPEIGEKVISSITFDDCQKAVLNWADRTVKFNTIKSYAMRVFKYARKNGLVIYNPFEDVEIPEPPKFKKSESEQFYTKKELTDFLFWAEKNLFYGDYTAFRLLAFSGLRKGELRALRWNDLSFKTMKLDINKAVKAKRVGEEIGPTKTNDSARTIGLDDDTIKILRKWKLEQQKYFFKQGIALEENQFIFPNEDNTTFMYRDHLRDVMKKYPGKQITIHGFRHTHATLSLDAGIYYKDVQKRLGHRTADMTMNVYAHAIGDDNKITKTFASYIEN